MKIPLKFQWLSLQGDATEFRQKSVEFTPISLYVVVELEATPENFANPEIVEYWEKATIFATGIGDKPVLVVPKEIELTLQGAKLVRELFNDAFHTQHPYAENNQDDENPKWNDWDENEIVKKEE